MSDLISRADVLAYPIRADHYDREHGNKHFIAGIESVMEYVECLPSAETEIIRCKDCKWFGEAGCAVMIVDDLDKPTEDDYCSFAERKEKCTP